MSRSLSSQLNDIANKQTNWFAKVILTVHFLVKTTTSAFITTLHSAGGKESALRMWTMLNAKEEDLPAIKQQLVKYIRHELEETEDCIKEAEGSKLHGELKMLYKVQAWAGHRQIENFGNMLKFKNLMDALLTGLVIFKAGNAVVEKVQSKPEIDNDREIAQCHITDEENDRMSQRFRDVTKEHVTKLLEGRVVQAQAVNSKA